MPAVKDNLLARHLARFLAEKSDLDTGKAVLFAELIEDLGVVVAEGHSCLPVNDDQRHLLAGSILVSEGEETPLVLYGNTLSFQKYFRYEQRLAAQLYRLGKRVQSVRELQTCLEAVFAGEPHDGNRQRQAAELAASRGLTIISGGPGTGKTTTVVRIISTILQLSGSQLRVALAAPTGKAAMRLRQSVVQALDGLELADELKAAVPREAMTLHRLLGVTKHSFQFRHNQENPLQLDLVVVDEASMVDLGLMSKLVDALPPQGRLVLLGDKDQLASVESGAVLADLVENLGANTVVLEKSYRFDRAISSLAAAVNGNDPDTSWRLLAGREQSNLHLSGTDERRSLYQGYQGYMDHVKRLDGDGYAGLFKEFSRFRILCAVRSGRWGVDGINALVENHYLDKEGVSEKWYSGRPVIINRNDYTLDLYNGDIGICLPDPQDGCLKVWFEAENGLRSYFPYRLPDHQTAFAMTVHKSQGSEFDNVVLVLPEEDNPVVSRELVYTGVTRARKSLRLLAGKEMLAGALARRTKRYSNLGTMLQELEKRSAG